MALLLLLPALALVGLMMIACPRPRPLPPCRRYAHRGLHDLAAGIPENSLAAFRRARAAGYGAELDVHLTADGRLAVLHDSDLRRLCGVEGTAEAMTAAALTRLPILGTGETVPLLEDVLDVYAGGPPLLLELKAASGNATALAEAVCRALEGRRGTFLLQSFHPLTLRTVRKLRPDLPRGQLSKSFLRDGAVHAVPAFFLTNLLLNWLSRPDFIAYRFADRRNPCLRLVRRLFGTALFCWTLTSPEEIAAADAEGCTTIFEGLEPAP